ncbi:DNA alkylation repair protein [archaeon]|nr:DNA alkylation repair protein [archaeon]
MSLHHILKDLQSHSDSKKGKQYKTFFRESYTDNKDRFLGVALPLQREIAKRHPELSYQDFQKLLNSDIHEYRMLAGILLVNRYRGNEFEREKVFEFYVKNMKKFNNWDLVDVTCDKIIGNFLLNKKKKRKFLYELVKSKNLWEKRISIVSTFEFIRNNEFGDTLKLSEKLLNDKHDLIHKAVGWMLREVGKRDEKVLLDFLKTNYNKLPRTTLRYSIERFPEEKRKEMLQGIFK